MIEGRGAAEGGNGPVAIPVAPDTLAALEVRVRRLEDALAVVQDTRPIEDRVVERLTHLHTAAPARNSADLIIDAGRHLLPAAVSVIHGDAVPTPAPAQPAAQAGRRPWLLWDILTEARAMLHMYVDPRYRMSWWGRLVPLALLAAILTSWVWMPGAMFLNTFSTWLATALIKLVDLVLAYFLFKVLAAEARRYRETAPALPPHLRL
jgi:hypothetical protein